MSTDSSQLTPSNILAGLVIVVVVIGLIILMEDVWPLGPDYYYTFRPVTEKVISGEAQLYTYDTQTFFNAPWTVLLVLPTTWFSVWVGQSMLMVTSLTILAVTPKIVRLDKPFPVYAWVFALLNLHTFDVFIRAQLDAFPLLGVAIGWWAIRNRRPFGIGIAIWLMAVKPLNVALAGFVYLIAMRHWSRREQIKALSIPTLSLLACFPLIGWDWPKRYVDNFDVYSPPREYLTLTLWRIARNIDLPFWPLYIVGAVLIGASLWVVWRKGVAPLTYSIALTTNLVLAQYATGNHYIYMIPAVLFISSKNWRLGLLAYATTFTPLLRAQEGARLAPVDIIYPIILMASAWFLFWQAEKEEKESSPPPAETESDPMPA